MRTRARGNMSLKRLRSARQSVQANPPRLGDKGAEVGLPTLFQKKTVRTSPHSKGFGEYLPDSWESGKHEL